MYCFRCGTKVDENTMYCPHCGANIKEEQEPSIRYIEFTPYEMQMSLEAQKSQWKWITDVTAGHLVILLYSFLEKH